MLKATENSVNTAYVEMESTVGVESVADAAVRAGIPAKTPGMDLDDLNLTFVLGTASPSGLSMANAYATFAAEGQRAEPYVVKEIIGPNDGLLFQAEPTASSSFTADVANTVTYALSRVVTDGTGGTALALGRPAAGKTGTTDDNKSAWFVGYTPQLAAAVLMAKETADGTPVSMAGTGGLETVTGGSFPAAIWTAFMAAALDGLKVKDFPLPPEGVDQPLDCPTSITAELEEVPIGCPTPEVFEFAPSEAPMPPSDPAFGPSESTAPSLEPTPSPAPESQSPDPSLFGPTTPPEPVGEAVP